MGRGDYNNGRIVLFVRSTSSAVCVHLFKHRVSARNVSRKKQQEEDASSISYKDSFHPPGTHTQTHTKQNRTEQKRRRRRRRTMTTDFSSPRQQQTEWCRKRKQQQHLLFFLIYCTTVILLVYWNLCQNDSLTKSHYFPLFNLELNFSQSTTRCNITIFLLLSSFAFLKEKSCLLVGFEAQFDRFFPHDNY